MIVVGMFATGCGGGDEAGSSSSVGTAAAEPPQQLTITVTDDSFDIPASLEAEPIDITLQNDGKAKHHAYFAELNEGVTEEDVRDAFPKGDDVLFQLIKLAGDITPVQPGDSADITMQFPEGNFFIVDPEVKEGAPPISFFEVTAASGPEVEEPAADYTIETGEFYFKIDDATAGEATIEIINAGEQNHEVGIADSKGKEVTTIFAPAPGGKTWTTLDLEPGDYQLVCYLQDPETKKPHIKLGMKQDFSVE